VWNKTFTKEKVYVVLTPKTMIQTISVIIVAWSIFAAAEEAKLMVGVFDQSTEVTKGSLSSISNYTVASNKYLIVLINKQIIFRY